jgi:hypothetical protein
MQLRISFSGPGKHDQALQRAEYEMHHYQETVALARNAYREMELELAASGFRFPDKIRKSLSKAAKQLAEFGHLVQEERCDAADIKNGELAETYKSMVRQARGWRLTGPLEAWSSKRLNKTIRTQAPDEQGEYYISPERMDLISQMTYRRVTAQAGHSFAVHPPKCILEDPDILRRDSLIEELQSENFKVVFQDGTVQVLNLTEFVFFTYELIFLDVQARDIAEKLGKGGFGPTEIQIQLEISIPELMRPELVKAVLSKVEFSSLAAENEPPSAK